MKNKKLFFTALVMSLYTLGAYAQLKISGEVRPRVEFKHGYKTVADSGQVVNAATTQRTRLNFDYTADKVKFYSSLQDVRTWGSQKQLVGNEDYGMSVHEAWAEINLSTVIALKAGRQEIVLDDSRMFGNVDWAQQARSHDAAILKYGTETIKAQFGFAFNRDDSGKGNLYTGLNAYKDLMFLHLNYKKDALNASLLALAKGCASDRTGMNDTPIQVVNYVATIGPRVEYKTDKLTAAFNFYYQLGTDTNAINSKVGATDLGIDLGYNLNDNISANLGYERLSGRDESKSQLYADDATKGDSTYFNSIQSFDPSFGTNHKFNGFMDYFYVGNWVKSVGLQDIYLKAGYKKDKISADLHYHLFMSAASILDDTRYTQETIDGVEHTYAAASSMLGHEIDITLGYTVTKGVAIKAGFSTFIAADGYTFVTRNKNVSDSKLSTSYWGWLMLVVTPTFLDTTPPKEDAK